MPAPVTRIISDLHYGDRASFVRELAQLRGLFQEVDAVILAGDCVDTRAGPHPEFTARIRQEVLTFAAGAPCPVTVLTGNHDPDISSVHWVELRSHGVFVTHGDLLFDDIVPWGRDAAYIRDELRAALGCDPAQARDLPFAERARIWRAIAAKIPQRHQSEQNLLRYVARFVWEMLWPPNRFPRIFRAWRTEPLLARDIIGRQFPGARYIVLGHTHRPAIRPVAGGPLVINTGSFTAPYGAYAVDVHSDRLLVQRIEQRAGVFNAGARVAEYSLA